METHSIAAIAAALTRAWEAGRICPHVGAGARARILALARLADQGLFPREEALQAAREAEALALCFSPLPTGDVP
ncbi:hypothetical protein [Methylobacterium aquaticum]|uniref:hypothetical protein n=1 Tax=Methylobacterium aquaticum TaxID=270351 RepID=UPI001932E79E|nr:hypothetical protein [Methylobacterium aquaticum]QRE76915.1 hypothetical protein F1D61_28210 [Methylobacterium aquaticum]